ncbi:MAG: hydrogenase maturation nickel metallochaperone HypA [Treponema sp.]|nr:hydrogenase maturation nickel metallochaperone HypA [Treponema sp.]
MHELGIMYHIVERVLGVVKENGFTEVQTIVLNVGEQAGVVPQYLHACYPAAVSGTMLENTSLKVDVVSGSEFMIKEIHAR